jgi:UPF0176 protein
MIVASFYLFTQISSEELAQHKTYLEEIGRSFNIVGHFIISPEGYNATVSGEEQNFHHFLNGFATHFNTEGLQIKKSWVKQKPFKILKVVIRPEIITLFIRKPHEVNHTNDISTRNNHISPSEWQSLLTSGEDILIVDTRNTYEWQLGTFDGAITPNIQKFSELPDYLDNASLPKDKKTLIFCTGGVRCEKAIFSFKERGFKEVYQLDGGILNYLESYPNSFFRGECFVFDKRVAVTQELAPSSIYNLCPHCGNPGAIRISCSSCSKNTVVCDQCIEYGQQYKTCSKKCRSQQLGANFNKKSKC